MMCLYSGPLAKPSHDILLPKCMLETLLGYINSIVLQSNKDSSNLEGKRDVFENAVFEC